MSAPAVALGVAVLLAGLLLMGIGTHILIDAKKSPPIDSTAAPVMEGCEAYSNLPDPPTPWLVVSDGKGKFSYIDGYGNLNYEDYATREAARAAAMKNYQLTQDIRSGKYTAEIMERKRQAELRAQSFKPAPVESKAAPTPPPDDL